MHVSITIVHWHLIDPVKNAASLRTHFLGDIFPPASERPSGSSSHLNVRTVCSVGRKDVFTPIEMSVFSHPLRLPPPSISLSLPSFAFHSADAGARNFPRRKRGAACRGHSYPLKKTKKNDIPFSQPGVITGLSSLSNFTFKEHFSGPPLLIPPRPGTTSKHG